MAADDRRCLEHPLPAIFARRVAPDLGAHVQIERDLRALNRPDVHADRQPRLHERKIAAGGANVQVAVEPGHRVRIGVQAVTEAPLGDSPEVAAVKAGADAEAAHAESNIRTSAAQANVRVQDRGLTVTRRVTFFSTLTGDPAAVRRQARSRSASGSMQQLCRLVSATVLSHTPLPGSKAAQRGVPIMLGCPVRQA